MVFLYHYTDAQGWNGIVSSGKILAQSPHKGRANMASGVYLTQIKPSSSDQDIIWNMYNLEDRKMNPKVARRCDYYFKFDSRQLPGVKQNSPKSGRNEWLSPYDVSTSKALVRGARKN